MTRTTRAFAFLGAFLLFTLEPLATKLAQPGFGGTVAAWAITLAFFQVALVAGYAWAFGVAARRPWLHALACGGALVLQPPSLGEPGDPASLALALAVRIGLPAACLCATSVLAQAWSARDEGGPWSLFAVSNAGALLGLVAYAVVIEPFVGLARQRLAWGVGFAAYALLAVNVAWRRGEAARRDAGAARAASATEASDRSSGSSPWRWAWLAAGPAALLPAVTSEIALEVGAAPLALLTPLAVYLASFVVAFGEGAAFERARAAASKVWPVAAALGLYFFAAAGGGAGRASMLAHVVALGIASTAAHAELRRTRPMPSQLGAYYLTIALGGGAAGTLVAVIAPVAFTRLWEYPLALVAIAGALLGPRVAAFGTTARVAAVGAVAIVVLAGWTSARAPRATRVIEARRSFHGLYTVVERDVAEGRSRELIHGTTRHGRELRTGPSAGEPLGYYARSGPLGAVLGRLRGPRRMGVVGLGIGAVAAHAEERDRVDFVEIDPVVASIARGSFGHLASCRGDVRVAIGEGRSELARSDARYDALVIDAFVGDAIPTHLLGREAIALYARRVTPHGVILVHVSSRHYDLAPIVAASARDLGLHARRMRQRRPTDPLADASDWIALARDPDALVHEATGVEITTPEPGTPWTDDHASALTAWRW